MSKIENKINVEYSSFHQLSSVLLARTVKSKINTSVLSSKNVRRLGPKDIVDVDKLVRCDKEKFFQNLFGTHAPHKHLTKRFLSLGIYTEEDDLVGLICFDNYPNIPALPPWEWDHWLFHHYQIDDMKPISTIWIYYALWDFRYTTLFAKPVLQHIFEDFETLQHVIYVCPPGIPHVEFLDGLTTRKPPVGFPNYRKVQSLLIAKREDFVCHYTIRRAVEEDNDDLVEIIPKHVEDTYGQFYISELISIPDTGRQIIVAEYKGCAVGVLCLNDEVNYDLLNEEFHLIPYNGFRKPRDSDEIIFRHYDSLNISEEVEKEPFPEDLSMKLTFKNEPQPEECYDQSETNSEDEYSLVSIDSSLIFKMIVDDEDDLTKMETDSEGSVDSAFSTLVLNGEGDYANHLFRETIDGDMFSDRRSIRKFHDEEDTPIFYGEPNAFSVEICAVLSDHESCLYLLFQAAFQCFPDRDYMTVSFPTNSSLCYITKHYARVTPRRNSTFAHELYVLHKNTVLGVPSVRVAKHEDKYALKDLLMTLDKPHLIEEQFRDAVDVKTSPHKAYVFLCEDQIVGSAVVTEEYDQEYLALHYDLDSWICTQYNKFGNYGVFEHFILSPIFQKLMNFYLRELHRLTNFYVCFYKINPFDTYLVWKKVPILNAIINMAPILPNPRITYDQKILEEYKLPEAMTQKRSAFALYLTTPRLTGSPRIEISQRMVVVGASATAIAFLESLLFSRNPRCLVGFNNVTIVTLQSIYQKRANKIHELAFVGDGHLDHRHLSMIGLRSYINIVNSVMTRIDRKEKLVYVNDQTCIPYDYLFLMCGQQFQKPPATLIQRQSEFPQNVFIVNTEADAMTATTTLRNLISTEIDAIPLVVVYGHYLQALCFLNLLLEFGLSPLSLIYIDPGPDRNLPKGETHAHLTNFFNNKGVEMTVLKEMLDLGITIYHDYKFVEWTHDLKSNVITNAKFESHYKMIEIELTALVLYYSKAVSLKTFHAIHRSGLVVNGRLVINKECQTNDPYIYAAGPLTMYSQKFHAEHLMHQYFNGQEIGYKLGQQFRKKLIPKQYWDYPSEPSMRHKPIVHHCKFPAKLHYLNVFKPGKPIPLDIAMANSSYGFVLTTGDLEDLEKQPYFRLHFNQYKTVETITCLSKKELNVENLISLYGRHETLFNNMYYRYCMNMIPDLYAYFRQPWLTAFYNPKFIKILNQCEDLWSTVKTPDGLPLIEAIKRKLEENNWNPIQDDEIVELCETTSYFERVEEKLLTFVQQNKMYLPMYVTKMLIRWIQHDISSSQLFVKCTKTMGFGNTASLKMFTPNM